MSSQKVVLITGATPGVGQATARLLSLKGYQVWGTSRDPSRAESIPNMKMLDLDVCDDTSVAACVKAVTDRMGRLDVLLNNAGYELAGALEEVSLDEAKAQYEETRPGPDLVAETVVRIIGGRTPRLRYVIGQQAKLVSGLRRFLPQRAFEIGSRSTFRLDAKK
jgi:NADP-dependent 3-hydroxy acid dehydrogenase YdfG